MNVYRNIHFAPVAGIDSLDTHRTVIRRSVRVLRFLTVFAIALVWCAVMVFMLISAT